MNSRRTRLWPVASFTFAYLAAALVMALTRGNAEFLFYIAVMLVLIACVYAVHRHVELSSGVLWGLSLWGLAHMVGGLLTVPAGWPVSSESRVFYTLWLIPGRLTPGGSAGRRGRGPLDDRVGHPSLEDVDGRVQHDRQPQRSTQKVES